MKKIREIVADHIGKALWILVTGAFAYLATLGDFLCHLLGLNAIYCDPFIISIQFFLVCGAVTAALISWARWRTLLRIFVSVAVALTIFLPIISRFAPLPRTPEEIIEFVLVAPFQFAIGVIVGQILIWAWAHFGLIIKAWLSKALGVAGSDDKANGNETS